MTVFLIISFGIAGIALSRIVFGTWFNHVSLYTGIWSFTLTFFELRMITYYPLEVETWIVIIACSLLFFFGAYTVAAMRIAGKRDHPEKVQRDDHLTSEKGIKRLKNVLWILNIITFTTAAHDLYIVSVLFGGFAKAMVLGNLLYSYRVSEGLPGSIPFIGNLVFNASVLAGCYTALRGRITLVSIVPLVTVTMIAFAKMGRVDILYAMLLFVSGYFLTPKPEKKSLKTVKFSVRKYLMLAVILVIVVGGAELIRSTRKVQEGFVGTTKTLQKMGTLGFITPSIYLYASAHYGILNKYLMDQSENAPFGGNTFLPFYRWLGGLGFEIHANPYQKFYRVPVYTNTGTYLREIDSDFGIAGLVVVPYILGCISSILWYRVKRRRDYMDIMVAAFFWTIIGLSFFVMATRQGQLIVYLAMSILISMILDRKPRAN
jgi:oligosaccharide repeat unit polymerase